ncbi:putative PX domain protein [Giardia duodenalis]|uniref:Putative PX domain protein n=1 Tax=Giardia intestinalis TaxID=5741 RepID=V6TA78_GIAIN|nr:putative PX domain protein [Giardia intestinalis]
MTHVVSTAYYPTAAGSNPVPTIQILLEDAIHTENYTGVVTPARLRNEGGCVTQTPVITETKESSDDPPPLSVCDNYTVCSNGGSHPFIVYDLLIPRKKHQVQVSKRFSTIKRLHADLLQEGLEHLPSFPRDRPWNLGGNRKGFVEERVREINNYFHRLLSNKAVVNSNAFKYFLSENDSFMPLESYTLR